MIRRARLTVLCLLTGWLVPGVALVTVRRFAYLPNGERRRRKGRA